MTTVVIRVTAVTIVVLTIVMIRLSCDDYSYDNSCANCQGCATCCY